jgi:hypothetical protein
MREEEISTFLIGSHCLFYAKKMFLLIFSKKFRKIKTKYFTKKIGLVLGIVGIFLMSGFLGGDSIIFRPKV